MVYVSTAAGNYFAATPNHPILTRRGWIGAGALVEGDEVFQRDVGKAGGTREPEVVDPPAPIGQVFDALAEAGLLERVPGLRVDFHGDGTDGDVDVVRADGDLLERFQADPLESIGNLLLHATHAALTRVTGQRALSEVGLRLADVLGVVAPNAESTVVADRYAALAHKAGETLDVDAYVSREGHEWLAANVSPDRVIEVERAPWSGHVYNLQTVAGCYFAGNILAHNCISRTESSFAYNGAQAADYAEAGVEWVELLDGIGDSICEEANGSVVPLDEYAADPLGHPQCSRTAVPSAVDDAGNAVAPGGGGE